MSASFQPLSQRHILVFSPRPRREFTTHPPHRFRDPSSCPNEAPHHPIHDANGDENAENISRHTAFASGWVEEVVRVEALGGEGDVRKCEVKREDHD